MPWTNWAGDQHCAPAAFAESVSEAEVVELVGHAREAGRTLRVAGSGHSFTDAACTDGQMLSLRRMARVIAADSASGLAEVGAGIRLRELGAALAERGLAMENLGDVDAQSLAGALATGTHGTGVGFRNLSAQVAGMRLVAADGSVVRCSAAEDPDLFRAARVGIGALGVVTSVTLRCQPLYTLHRVDEQRPLGEVLDRLDELAAAHERFELFTFPYSGVCLTRITERTDAEPKPPTAAARWLGDVALKNGAFGAFCRVARAAPRLVPAIDMALGRLTSGGVRTDLSARIYANPRLVRFTEMEYAVPRSSGAEVVRAVLDVVERRRLPIVFPLEVRFAAGDDAILSSAYERDSCYVAVHQYRGMEYESYFRVVEEIMDAHDGRPHWGKRHYQSAATLRPRYPEWDRFAAVRDRVDPERLFENDYTRRVLGP